MVSEHESACRAFADAYPVPNVIRGIRHAERGEITWINLYRLFQRSMTTAMSTVGNG